MLTTPCRKDPPCIACGTKQFSRVKQVSRCKHCGWATYCSQECLRNHKDSHAPLCDRLKANPRYTKILDRMYELGGIFTDGTLWSSVPMNVDSELAIHIKNMEQLGIKESDVPGDVSDRFASLFTGDATEGKPAVISCSLIGPTTVHHSMWRGMMHPNSFASIADWCRMNNIDEIIDPMASNGAFEAAMRIFGATGASELGFKMLSFGEHEHRFPIIPVHVANPLSRRSYPTNTSNKLVVLSWPDETDRGKSVKMINMLAASGFRNILLLSSTYDMAISPEGMTLLESLYRKDRSVIFTPLAASLDLRPKYELDSPVIHSKVAKFVGIYVLK